MTAPPRKWIVRLLDGAQHWGPFDCRDDAEDFAAFVTAEVDPCEFRMLVPPASELLVWWKGHAEEPTGAEPEQPTATRLTYDEAVALLPDGDTIHTFVDGAFTLIGADWAREQILDLLRDGTPEVSGRSARAMDHGIVVLRPDEAPLFVATKPVA